MSRFSGPQSKGAMRHHREKKQDEARARNAVSNASMKVCGHVHGEHLICEGWDA